MVCKPVRLVYYTSRQYGFQVIYLSLHISHIHIHFCTTTRYVTFRYALLDNPQVFISSQQALIPFHAPAVVVHHVTLIPVFLRRQVR